MSNILVIEDDASILEPLAKHLVKAGFSVTACGRLTEAARSDLKQFSLIVLDWELPDGEGIDFLKNLRQQGLETPVIFLTARTDLIDKILGLEMGADDYMTKPFEVKELIARIRVRLRDRKAASAASPVLDLHGVVLDKNAKTVHFRGQPVELAKMEFALLLFFMENAGKALARDEILNKVWGYENFPSSRTVDTHVLLLRQKLDDSLFETLRGVGYRFKAKP